MANSDTSFILSTKTAGGSAFTQLTSGVGAGKLKYIDNNGIVSPNAVAAAGKGGTVTGLVIPLHGATITSFPDSDGASLSHAPKNIIGDPAVGDYSLTSGDFVSTAGAEINGGAQKFVNAILDSSGEILKFESFGFRLGGAGLGNILFPWANAVVYAKKNNLERIQTTWVNLKFGTFLRKEKDKRMYLNLFTRNDGIMGIRKTLLLNFSSRILIFFNASIFCFSSNK